MAIKFLQAGMQTSLQDLGRPGYRSIGISQAGAIDSDNFKLANWLVGNPVNNPCLEIYLGGPVLEFTQDMVIGIAGAKFQIFINDKLTSSDQTLFVNKGDILKFGQSVSGARAYIAFNGSPKDEQFLNSYSCDTTSQLGYNSGKSFHDNQILDIQTRNHTKQIRLLPAELNTQYPKNMLIRVTKGMEFDLLTEEAKRNLFEQSFSVSHNSNRMGLRTSGQALQVNFEKTMISSPVTVGTIQLPTNGQPIVLLNEGQTIGGYPRIGQVISTDLPLLGQITPHSKISFYLVNIAKAIDINHFKKNSIANL